MTVEPDKLDDRGAFRPNSVNRWDGSFRVKGWMTCNQSKGPVTFLRLRGLTGSTLPFDTNETLLSVDILLVSRLRPRVNTQVALCFLASNGRLRISAIR